MVVKHTFLGENQIRQAVNDLQEVSKQTEEVEDLFELPANTGLLNDVGDVITVSSSEDLSDLPSPEESLPVTPTRRGLHPRKRQRPERYRVT